MRLLKILIVLMLLTTNLKSYSQNTRDSIQVSTRAFEKIYKDLKVCEEFYKSYNRQKFLTETLIKGNLKKINTLQIGRIKIELKEREIKNLIKTNEKITLKAKRRARGIPIVGVLAFITGIIITK